MQARVTHRLIRMAYATLYAIHTHAPALHVAANGRYHYANAQRMHYPNFVMCFWFSHGRWSGHHPNLTDQHKCQFTFSMGGKRYDGICCRLCNSNKWQWEKFASAVDGMKNNIHLYDSRNQRSRKSNSSTWISSIRNSHTLPFFCWLASAVHQRQTRLLFCLCYVVLCYTIFFSAI